MEADTLPASDGRTESGAERETSNASNACRNNRSAVSRISGRVAAIMRLLIRASQRTRRLLGRRLHQRVHRTYERSASQVRCSVAHSALMHKFCSSFPRQYTHILVTTVSGNHLTFGLRPPVLQFGNLTEHQTNAA